MLIKTIKTLFFILFLVDLAYSEIPSVRGEIYVNDTNFANAIYNYIITKSSNCVRITECWYDISIDSDSMYPIYTSTYTIYCITFMLKFNNINHKTELYNKIKQYKDDPRVEGARFCYHICRHDEGVRCEEREWQIK